MKLKPPLVYGGFLLIGIFIGAALMLVAGPRLFLGLQPEPARGLVVAEIRAPQPPSATPAGASVLPSPSQDPRPPATPPVQTPSPPPTATAVPEVSPASTTLTPQLTDSPVPLTALPSPTTVRPASTATSLPTAILFTAATPLPTATPVPPAATAPASATSVPPSLSPSPTVTPISPTPTPSSTAASSVRLTGRVVYQATPVGAGVVVELETNTTITTTTDAEGKFAFGPLPLNGGFSVVFAQAWNSQHYAAGQAASWAWLRSFVPSTALTINVPDLEISLVVASQRFEQSAPPAGASISIGQISASHPLQFEWTPYFEAQRYWVDLGRENATSPIWQSYLVVSATASFDGTLSDRTTLTAGNYWWAVGAQKQVGIYQFTVYGYPRPLSIVSP